MSENIGLHPDSGLYHTDHMPLPEDAILRSVREKQLAGEPLSIFEKMHAGRDTTFTQFGDFEAKPDHVYRAVDQLSLAVYEAEGAIVGQGEHDEFIEGKNNSGVDWCLGAVALKYGDIIIEMPAAPEYIHPAGKQGAALAKDPKIRHMKSSGTSNPVPLEMTKVYIKDSAGLYQLKQ